MNGPYNVPIIEQFNDIDPAHIQFIFHGINKSGSWAMAKALEKAFKLAGRSKELHVHYFNGDSYPAFASRVSDLRTPGFYIGHNLYGAVKAHPRRVLLTQFRHPLPRVLSCYNWLKNIHEREQKEQPFPDLDVWIERTKGKSHSQIMQFGCGYGHFARSRLGRLSARDLFEISVDAIEREIFHFGIAEYFEESLFLIASLCRLPAIMPWVRDERNPGRMLSSEISANSRKLIEEVFEYDFKLYAFALEQFKRRSQLIEGNAEIVRYKEMCSVQYNDRIII